MHSCLQTVGVLLEHGASRNATNAVSAFSLLPRLLVVQHLLGKDFRQATFNFQLRLKATPNQNTYYIPVDGIEQSPHN
jgi:hypothetical protein